MNYGILLAGGMGTRLGLQIPKQFLKLGKKTLLEHTVEKFALCPFVDHTVVVVPEVWFEQSTSTLAPYGFQNVSLCCGGASRQDSLFNGLKFLKENFEINDEDIAISHDVARPFVTTEMIRKNIEVCKKFGAADTVIPAIDTIVESVDGQKISSVPVRQNMYQGQTPQTFHINSFIEIYEGLTDDYLSQVTDAARILSDHGVSVGLAFGDYSNIKVTTLFDLQVANAILNQYCSRRSE